MSAQLTSQAKFLVVEDDELVRDLTVDLLRGLGYVEIDTAINGNAALGKVISSTHPFDIIICDLNMPEMDGVEFVRHLDECGFAGGLIIVSGEEKRVLDIARDMASGRNINILDAIRKPYTQVDLEAVLGRYTPVERQQSGSGISPLEILGEEELRQGIFGDGEELLLLYQPIVHIRSGEITAVEALARWKDPQRGLFGPEVFLPTAEQFGLVTDLTRKVLNIALQQLVEFQKKGEYLKMSINCSTDSFETNEFANELVNATTEYSIRPSALVLEFSERPLIDRVDSCKEAFMQLRFKRVGLSIDDFGISNLSLEQIERIPFTELKVSRAFVSGAHQSEFARTKLEEAAKMAKLLSMESIAKGVESVTDWQFVEKLGFSCAQGTFCSPPLTPENLLNFLDSWKPPPRG